VLAVPRANGNGRIELDTREAMLREANRAGPRTGRCGEPDLPRGLRTDATAEADAAGTGLAPDEVRTIREWIESGAPGAAQAITEATNPSNRRRRAKPSIVSSTPRSSLVD
jgi:hypothetical protein